MNSCEGPFERKRTSNSYIVSEDGPWNDDTVSYTYQNRLRTGLSVLAPNGSPWTQTYAYDAARRLTNVTSSAGSFGYGYDPTRHLQVGTLTLPNRAYIAETYDSVDRLLSTTLKNSAGTVLNSHSYQVNLANQRTALTNAAGDFRLYGYDGSGQLKTAVGYEGNGAARLHEKLGYAYDAAGNLNWRTNNALGQQFQVNSLNELTTASRTTNTTLTVAGATTSPATNVTVNSLAASLYADTTFAKDGFSITNGSNQFTAIAKDSYGRSDTNTSICYLPSTNSFVYDLNGNLLSDGNRSFAYDDENQLISVWVTNIWRSDFVYDGKMRRRIRKEYQWRTGNGQTNAFITGVTPGTLRNNHPGWVGFQMVVGSAPLTVTDLGRWVVSGNSNSHTVKIVRSDGTDLPGGSVSVATAGATNGQFKYASLSSPVQLASNTTYYVVSQEVSGGDYWYDMDTVVASTGDASLAGYV